MRPYGGGFGGYDVRDHAVGVLGATDRGSSDALHLTLGGPQRKLLTISENTISRTVYAKALRQWLSDDNLVRRLLSHQATHDLLPPEVVEAVATSAPGTSTEVGEYAHMHVHVHVHIYCTDTYKGYIHVHISFNRRIMAQHAACICTCAHRQALHAHAHAHTACTCTCTLERACFLRPTSYLLCTMHYALCTMHYALLPTSLPTAWCSGWQRFKCSPGETEVGATTRGPKRLAGCI